MTKASCGMMCTIHHLCKLGMHSKQIIILCVDSHTCRKVLQHEEKDVYQIQESFYFCGRVQGREGMDWEFFVLSNFIPIIIKKNLKQM